MEADNNDKCILHEKNDAIIVCVAPECNSYRICCPQCLTQQLHKGHKLISFNEYRKIRERLSKIQPYYKEDITGKINEAIKKLTQSLKKLQEAMLQNFMTYQFCLKQAGQQQQQMGEIQLLSQDPLFMEALENNDEKDLTRKLEKTSLYLIQQLVYLREQLLVKIENTYQQINKFHSNTSKIGLRNKKIGMKFDGFHFSDSYGHNLIEVGQNKTIAYRKDPQKKNQFTYDYFGLTVHQLVHAPLTQEQNEISFMIKKQPIDRFIYFGICQFNKFRQQNFTRGYQMGGGMIGIRQNHEKGQSALCLHDYLADYSNKPIVNWDFDIDDKVTIRLNFEKSMVEFYKNGKQKFQMPFKNKQDYFPFIGLKYTGDTVAIVQ